MSKKKQLEQGAMSAKREPRKRRFRLGTLILLVAFAFVTLKFGQQYQRIQEMRQEAQQYEKQYAAVLAEKEKLEEEKELLSEPTYIERLAREKLGLVKNGEVLVVPAEENDEVEEYKEDVNPGDIH